MANTVFAGRQPDPDRDDNSAAGDGAREAGNDGATQPLGTNSEIGRKLKQYYDEIVSEDVPDRFADLLRQLEDRENASSADRGE